MTDVTALISQQDVAKKAMENIKDELVQEQVDMVKDFVKGAYRMRYELEQKVEQIKKKMADTDAAILAAESGDLQPLKNLKVPARFLSEKTVRLNNIDWEE